MRLPLKHAKTLNVAFKKDLLILARVESNRGLIEEYDRQAEQQRQIRDNDLISIEQRIVANDKLKETLEEQERLMLTKCKSCTSSSTSTI